MSKPLSQDRQLEELKQAFERRDLLIESVLVESVQPHSAANLVFQASARYNIAAELAVTRMEPEDALRSLEKLTDRLNEKYSKELDNEPDKRLLKSKLVSRETFWKAALMELQRSREEAIRRKQAAPIQQARRYRRPSTEEEVITRRLIRKKVGGQRFALALDNEGVKPPRTWHRADGRRVTTYSEAYSDPDLRTRIHQMRWRAKRKMNTRSPAMEKS